MKRVISIFFTLTVLLLCISGTVSAQGLPVYAAVLSENADTPLDGDSGNESTASTSGTTEAAVTTTTTTAPPVPPAAPVVTYTDAPVSTYVDVKITCADGSVLPEGWKMWYSTDANTWLEYTGDLAVDINCTLSAKVTDADGLESAVTEVIITCIDKLPPSPPEILADAATWVNDFVDVSVVSGTDAESGILRSEYRIGEEGTWHEYTDPVQITSPGVFYARSVDLAGNTSSMASLELNNFDFTPPDVTLLNVKYSSSTPPVITDSGVFGQYYRDSVTVTIDGASDSQSGIGGYQYQLAGSSNPTTDDGWLNYDPAVPPVISGNFCGYVCVRAIDNTGNVSLPFNSANLVVDTEAPVIAKINFSTTEITDNRVIVTFNITDNIWLDSVMVGNSYLGTYDPTFTVFRNGDYTVTAADKAGNVSTAKFSVKNIDATPFSMLSIFEQLDEDSFTPSTWVNAAAAADELQRLLTVETNSELVATATEKLTASMEALVSRGDGTMALELIDRVLEYDKTKYTESSWQQVDLRIADIRLCLDEPESTQADVDTARRSLEQAVSELALLGNFSSLDRLIKQCESINKTGFDPVKYEAFTAVLNAAQALPRNDSTQADVDSAYAALLAAMDAMKVPEEEEKQSIPFVGYVIIGLLVIFTGTVLFIIFKSSANSSRAVLLEENAESEFGGEQDYDTPPNIGDFCFSDDDSDTDLPEI